jgi:amino acid adenylation domain-containing protein
MIPPPLHAAATPLLHDYLIESARRLPDKIALSTREGSLTYAELHRCSEALAAFFAARGVERGDRVLIFAENGAEAVIAFWAALQANAVPSVVSPLVKADKLRYLLDDCRPRALVASSQLAAVFEPAAAGSRHLALTLVAGDLPAERLAKLPGGARWEEALAEPSPPPPRRALDVDLACLVYTSGSTGEPKGVMLTHRNMLTAATSITTYLENREDDVILGVLPLAFDYGLYQMIMAFRMGARLVLLRSFAYPAEVLGVMQRERVTGFPGVPTMFAVLAEMKGLAKFDLSAIRYVTSTAAALPEKHLRRLIELFPAARIYSMYGLTECKRCTYVPPAMLERKIGSVGIAIPNTELWLVDEEGRRLGPNQVGELVIRGATVMRGYWEKPEQTAKKLRPGPLPGEQVLYTGDLCRLDEDGYLYFVGRRDDIIKSKGEKVAPKEVEAAIYRIPGVKACAVIGVPDPVFGQAVKAFVVPEAGASLAERQILGECQARLESFMVPRTVEIVGELPVTNTGKIKKTGLS